MLRPVVLTHGLLATPGLLRPLRAQLRALGHDAYLATEVSPLVTGDVRVHAEELDRAVERVRRQTGAERVDVVGTSQGGIVALWWAHQLGWERLGRLVAMGTPFRGAPVARWFRWLGPVSEGLRQIQPNGPFLQALAAVELERPVTSVSVDTDPVCPPGVCALPGMEVRVVDGPLRPVAHQAMMFHPRVVRAVHEALVQPC